MKEIFLIRAEGMMLGSDGGTQTMLLSLEGKIAQGTRCLGRTRLSPKFLRESLCPALGLT